MERFGFTDQQGSVVQLFEDFQNDWKNIDKQQYSPMEKSIMAKPQIKTLREEATSMLVEARLMNFHRDDYKDIIELTLLVLGVEIPNYSFKLPGANHRASWMGIIYAHGRCSIQ
jgi:hypothetical protein